MVRLISSWLHLVGVVAHAAELASQHQFLESHPPILQWSRQKTEEGHGDHSDFYEEANNPFLDSRRMQGTGRVDQYFNFSLAIIPGEDSDVGLTDLPATRTIVIGTDALKSADVTTADYRIIPNGILSNAQVTSRYHIIR
jgi:hypothetical protein